jgi:signal transduction histidine kinase
VRQILDGLIGGFEIVLAVIVLRHLWRFRRGFPWLLVLTTFFLVRGIDRITIAFTGRGAQSFGFVLDALLLLVLSLLLVTMERVVRGLELAEDAARLREQEYERALAHYRRLVRHRLANPLAAIFGCVRFLRELAPAETRLRGQLLATLEQETERLKSICLDPDDEPNPEERDLQPRPNLDSAIRDGGVAPGKARAPVDAEPATGRDR